MNPRPTGSRPATVDETLAAIRGRCRPLDAEPVPLESALGRVLREPVRADADQPPFDRSSMDGYAVRMDDPSESFQVVDRIRAGDWKPRELKAGEAVQIATGGAVPGEGLQVVMKEDVRVEGERLVVAHRDEERHIRFQGEDAKAGHVLVEAGTPLGPGALALLASVGCTNPRVSRLPRVVHLVTGNEIVPPESPPARGQIRDSNTTLVRAFLHPFGIEPEQTRVGEDRTAIQSALRRLPFGIDEADLLLVSGGASVGEHDFTRGLLEERGYTIHVSRTTTRPGKPLIFGSRGDAVAFGLPGNPLAHFVCLNLYVRQALWRFSGRTDEAEFRQGVLAETFTVTGNPRETLWPARMEVRGGQVRLTLLPWHSSGDLTALATANALARIAPHEGTLSRGAELPFLPT